MLSNRRGVFAVGLCAFEFDALRSVQKLLINLLVVY